MAMVNKYVHLYSNLQMDSFESGQTRLKGVDKWNNLQQDVHHRFVDKINQN